MKKLLLLFVTMLLLHTQASGALFSTSPAILQEDSKDVKIYFDASKSGVQALMNASVLYAHIGVTLQSAPTAWTHVIGTWSTNTDNKKFAKTDNGLWELKIGDIKTYFGITDPNEKIAKIAIIARTADGRSQTADNFIDIYEPGFKIALSSDAPSLVLSENKTITFTASATEQCSLSITVDDTVIGSGNNVSTITGSYSFNQPETFHKVKATANNGSATVSKEITVAYPGASPVATYPGGIPKQGAIKNADGTVTFCIAAPNKTSALLLGSWDDYVPSINSRMNRHDYNGIRYFWVTVNSLPDNQYLPYYYLIDTDTAVGDPYAKLVLDPWNDRYLPEGCFDDMPAYPYDKFNDKMLAVYRGDIDDYNWDNATTGFKIPDSRNLNIYELLLRDFTGDGSDTDGKKFGTLRTAHEKIPYLKDLGINAVELLPIMEFGGNNSWGYNTNFYMAIDKAYGSPRDMRDFVAECHRQGIAVILDIVLNQSDGLHPWYQMYPSSSNPFYNATAPHSYSVLNDWNQDYPLVEQYWDDVLTYWMEAYQVDGFRFDLVKGLGSNESYGSGGNSATDRYNESRVTRMKKLHATIKAIKPNAIHINELLGNASEDNANGADGQLGWSNVNSASASYACGTGSPDLRGFYANQWGRVAGQTVDYAESHDEKRIARAVIESGHSSVKYSSTPSQAAIKRLGSVAAQMLLCPGAKMIWQFGEVAADDYQGSDLEKLRAIKPHWDDFSDPGRNDLYKLYRALCHLRLLNPEMFNGTDAICTLGNFSSSVDQTRYLTLCLGDKEIVALFNADVNQQSRVASAPVSVITPSNATLIASSPGTTPTLNSTVSGQVYTILLPGEFGIWISDAVAGIDTPENDMLSPSNTISVGSSNQSIVVAGDYDSAQAFNFQGISTPIGKPVAPGIYIVVVDGKSFKVAVK